MKGKCELLEKLRGGLVAQEPGFNLSPSSLAKDLVRQQGIKTVSEHVQFAFTDYLSSGFKTMVLEMVLNDENHNNKTTWGKEHSRRGKDEMIQENWCLDGVIIRSASFHLLVLSQRAVD